jgi:hypothetical protein
MQWRVVELWTVPAKTLLASGNPGLMPWLPLTNIAGSPKPVFQHCRDVIDKNAAPEEHENLLAVTQILAKLRYNDPQLLQILGGRKAMIESPLIQELLAERMHADILMVLESRFGPVPRRLRSSIRDVTDEQKLTELVKLAACCHDLKEFRECMREKD